MKQLLVALGEDLSCPICLEQLTPPVVQCKSGHNACSQCKTGCQQCPLCREPFVETPNRALDTILQLLPKPCLYADVGCPDRVSDNHQPQFCLFRPIKCQIGLSGLCTWTGTVMDWLEHSAKHGMDTGNVVLDIGSMRQFDAGINFRQYSYKVRVKESYFLLTLKQRSGILTLNVERVLTQKPSEDYFFQIVFRGPKGKIISKAILKPSVLTENQDIEQDSMRMDVLLKQGKTVFRDMDGCGIRFFVLLKSTPF